MNSHRWGIVVAALLTPGIAAAGPAAWCKDKTDEGSYEVRKLSQKDVSNEDLMVAIAKLSCSTNAEVEPHRAEIEKARAAWGKKFGMADADWPDLFAFDNARLGNFLKTDYSVKVFAQMTPIDQYWAIHEGFQGASSDPLYMADALDGQLTETGRLAFLSWCVKGDSFGKAQDNAARWAICQADIDKLNIPKLLTELHGDTAHSGEARMWLRFHAFDIQDEMKKMADEKAKAIKADDEYKKVFDMAAKARDEWTKTIGANTKLLELVQATDAGIFFQSRKLLDGCEAKTADALAAEVGKLPAKTFAGMNDNREDPFAGFAQKAGPVLAAIPSVHLAAIAYVECQPKSATGDFLGAFIQYAPGARGPRSAALAALLGAEKQFKFDDMNAKLSVPKFDARPYSRSGGSVSSAGGVVKSTKKDKESLVVALEKTVRKQEDCVKEHYSNRINAIRPDGTLSYEIICDKWEIVAHDSTWTDFKVNPNQEKILKKGLVFSAVRGEPNHEVVAMWPSKDAKLPNWVLGATVK
jgi:hypothetical protein